MTCEYKKKLQNYLDETLAKSEMQSIERHLDTCEECQRQLDSLLNSPVAIPGQPLEVDDEVLVSKIKSRVKGVRRITIYGIFGFALGLFSRFYTMDDFIVTKAIMALPYKLAEFFLNIFFSGNALKPWQQIASGYHGGMGFFPYHPLLDFLAGLITPAIVGAFIAMMVGYLVSDKRVFQRKKIINFFAAGLVISLVWAGILHGVYTRTLARIGNLEGISGVTVYTVKDGTSSWLIGIEREALSQGQYAGLVRGVAKAEKIGMVSYPEDRQGWELLIDFSGGGRIPAYVNEKTGEMIMLNGQSYRLDYATLAQLKAITEVVNHE